MNLILRFKSGQSLPIKVEHLNTLNLPEDEKEPFNATLQAYLQHLYHDKKLMFTTVKICKRFQAGRSGAIVFSINLFTPGGSSNLNQYRILKYDYRFRIEQEVTRFNNIVSPNRYEEIQACYSENFPQKALLAYRDISKNAAELKELLDYILELSSAEKSQQPEIQRIIIQVLEDVLDNLYRHYYCGAHSAVSGKHGNRTIREVFAEIFQAKYTVVQSSPDSFEQDAPDSFEQEGSLVGIIAVANAEYPFLKKYLVVDRAKQQLFRVDVKVKDEPPQDEVKEFLATSIDHFRPHRIIGRLEDGPCSLKDYIQKAVDESQLNNKGIRPIKAESLYRLLGQRIDTPYAACYLHHDLNPGNIMVVKRSEHNVHGELIDYYSFGPGGHLFTDVARLEALMIMEYLLGIQEWNQLFWEEDYAELQARTNDFEMAISNWDADSERLNEHEKAIVEIVITIRSIGLNWLRKQSAEKTKVREYYKNYLFARYAYLIAFQKYSDEHGSKIIPKKQLALLFADALRKVLEKNFDALAWNRIWAMLERSSDIHQNLLQVQASGQAHQQPSRTKDVARRLRKPVNWTVITAWVIVGSLLIGSGFLARKLFMSQLTTMRSSGQTPATPTPMPSPTPTVEPTVTPAASAVFISLPDKNGMEGVQPNSPLLHYPADTLLTWTPASTTMDIVAYRWKDGGFFQEFPKKQGIAPGELWLRDIAPDSGVTQIKIWIPGTTQAASWSWIYIDPASALDGVKFTSLPNANGTEAIQPTDPLPHYPADTLLIWTPASTKMDIVAYWWKDGSFVQEFPVKPHVSSGQLRLSEIAPVSRTTLQIKIWIPGTNKPAAWTWIYVD